MKSLLLGIFFGLASFASAQNPPCQGGVGGSVFATGDDVEIEIIQGAAEASFTSRLYLFVSGQEWIYCGTNSGYGTITTVSNLVAGDELSFRIYISAIGESFVIGPAIRNPDGVAHAEVFCETNGATLVGFEDSYGGGDLNYQDVLFQVRNIPARPAIVTQPVSQSVDVGMNAAFSVVASGSGPLFYQWFKGNAPIAGATHSLLSLTNLQEADQGAYSVSVSNTLGQVSSSPAQLTVNRWPVAEATAVRHLVVSANGKNAVVTLDGSRSSDADEDALRYAWFESGATNAFAATKVALIAAPVGTHSFSLVVSDGRLSSTNGVVVKVATVSEALQDLLARVNQAVVRAERLRGTLQAAINSYRRGNLKSVKNQLQIFEALVRARVAPGNAELAAELIQVAQDIRNALNAPPTQLLTSASSPFQIDLAWTDSLTNEDGFKIERSTDGVHFTQIAQVLPNTTTFRNTGLFPETTYSYRVRSFRGAVNGSYSNVRAAATPGSACAMSVAKWNDPPWIGYVPDPPEGLSQVVSVAGGLYHALALKSDGTVVGWGADYFGESTPPPGLSGVVAIAAGAFHSLALKSDGTVVAFGGDAYVKATTPSNLSGVVAIAASEYHSLALKSDGTVMAWGSDYVGQLPVPAGLKGVVAIATSQSHSMALKSDGTVVAWGDDYAGQVTVPAGLRGVVAIAAGSGRSLALKNDGTVAGWGAWVFGQPMPPTNAIYATAIAAGNETIYGLLPDGTVKEWGYPLPQPEGLRNVQAIFASGNTAYALTTLPSAPGIQELRIASQDQIELAWTNYDSGADGFVIERATQYNGLTGNWSQIGATAPATTRFSDPRVTTGSTYWYRVQTQNACGKSLSRLPWVINFTPASAPRGLEARMGYSNRVDVSWYDNHGNANGFVLERAPDVAGDPGDWAEIATINATNDLSHQYGFADANVTGFTTNWYRVRAFNPLGVSPYSDLVRIEIVPPATAPHVEAYSFRDQVTIYWWYSSDVGATGYQIERAPDVSGSPGAWSVIGTDTNFFGSWFFDYPLGLGTYWYRVQANNWVGVSPESSPVSVTITSPSPPMLRASVGTTNRVEIHIESASPYDQDGFKIERAADVLGSPGTWMEIGAALATNYSNTHFTDTNVTANTTNWYRARAFNLLGYSDYSPPSKVELVPPPPPDYLWARSSRDWVYTSWIESYAGHLDGFQIDRAPDVEGSPGAWRLIATNINSGGSLEDWYTDSGLGVGTYWYRLRAYNWLGLSSNSSPAAATVALPESPQLVVTVGSSNHADVYLYHYPGDEDGFKLERAADVSGSPGKWAEIATIKATNINYATYQDTNVTANTTNWYRARTFNPVGYSAYCEPVELELVPPPPPENVYVSAFADRVSLYWYRDYPVIVDGFQIDRAPDMAGTPGEWSQIATTPNAGHDNFFTDAGLILGRYWYRIRAFNWLGLSSNCIPRMVEVVPPAAPQIFAAIGRSNNQADVSFSAGGIRDQNGFTLERATDDPGGSGTWSEIAIVPNTNEYYASYTDTNVTANTTNWYRARAFSAVGYSAYSGVIRLDVVPPTPPYYLTASAFSNQINLTWYEDYSPVDGYTIERAPDVSGSPGVWSLIATNPAGAFTDGGFMLGTYWYRVRAYNWVGESSNSEAASATVVPPGTPKVYANIGTTNQADVYIDPAPPGDQDAFRLERAADEQGSPGPWLEIATLTTTHYTETNVLPNTTNWYRARAFNGLGTSDYSIPFRLDVSPPPAPTAFSGTPYRDTVQLSWFQSYAGPVDGYLIERAPDVSGAPGPWTLIGTNANYAYYGNTYADTNLSLGSYWYRVRTYNWVGVSTTSQELKVTVALPGSPSITFSFGNTNSINIQIQGLPPYDQEGFNVERADDVQGNPGAWTQIGNSVTGNGWGGVLVDTNVQAYTTNWYRARSFNSLGNSDYSAPLSVAIIPPATPTNFTASRYGNAMFLSWAAAEGFAERYELERAADSNHAPGSWGQLAIVYNFSSWYYFDYPPNPNGAYWYHVRARNWVGASAFSPAVSVNLPPTQLNGVAQTIGSLQITSLALSNGSVQIHWQTTGGTTNFVEAATTLAGPFSIISPAIVIPGAGITQTNFEDGGPMLNASQRFYRIQSR